MTQIQSIGVYVPYYRLKRSDVAEAWHSGPLPGERSVANIDEDSLTMGVEASLAALEGVDLESVDAVYFATTTPPYLVKQSAALLSYVIGLRSEVFTADFSDSLRAGTSALISALDAVDAGRARLALVVASDCRYSLPASTDESLFGDAACALLVGSGGGGLAVTASRTKANALIDTWQRPKDRFIQNWEDRFAKGEGYQRETRAVVKELLAGAGIDPNDVAAYVLSSPDFRSSSAVVKSLKVDPKQKLADPLMGTIGNCGAAGALVSLCNAVSKAAPGDRLVVANYGDGCDALVLEAGDDVGAVCKGPSLQAQTQDKAYVSYMDYLRFRDLIENRLTDIPDGPSSAPTMMREAKALLGLVAHRCRKCGTMHHPMERVCYNCHTKDDFDEVPLARETGSLFTYTKDTLFQSPDPPQVMAVVESVEGCRLYLQMTDRDPDEVKLKMPLRFTFRRLHEGAGFHNYFWKCRPERAATTGGQ